MTLRGCWRSSGSSRWMCGLSEMIVIDVRWRDRHVRGPGPVKRFPCGPARLNRPRVTQESAWVVRGAPGHDSGSMVDR